MMKNYFVAALFLLVLPGCSSPQNEINSMEKYREVSEKRLTIREIDSVTADNNFAFSKKNIVTTTEKRETQADK